MTLMWWRSSQKISLERYGEGEKCVSHCSVSDVHVHVLCSARVPSTPDPSGLSVVMNKEDFNQIRVRTPLVVV